METMSYPVATHTQPHLRETPTVSSRVDPAAAIAPQHARQQPPLSAPASQESIQSAGSSVGAQVQNSPSNVSQITNYTDPASLSEAAPHAHATADRPGTKYTNRERTPEDKINGGFAVASPLNVTSPAANGTKRTASGHVKNAPSLPSTPMTEAFTGRRARAESLSSTGSRAGELAATLKTRLGYAMAKVQHGWEHKNLAEVEQLAASKMSPNSHGIAQIDQKIRPVSAGLSSETANLSMYDRYSHGQVDGAASPPPKRRSGNWASMVHPAQPVSYAHGVARHLQPPVDLRPNASSRAYHTAPSSQQGSHGANAMSPPRTPVNTQLRRPATIRTDTQTAEAERDALQALFQLGSPHASQVSRQTNNASQASSSQASPLRTEYPTPRKVTFARSSSDVSSRGDSADSA
ncbi:Whi5 like [Teratosphaeria destructans]|uniref:Whi5 like n=1 Tax=Teratosphaeria destructans TaxID=418781 RepID=A0A9W7SJ42_9PEZI|nr:Whi5 like [Teratosphaeria destructans]